jgi:hypothetical protein
MRKCGFFLSVFWIPLLVWSQGYLTNGSFESGYDVNWSHTVEGDAAASFSGNQTTTSGYDGTQLGPKDGSRELKIDLTTASSSDKYAVSASTTATVGSDSIYVLRFWVRESEFFEYQDGHDPLRGGKEYTAHPDFASMIVTITTESGHKYEVDYKLRYGHTTFFLPFKSFEKEFTIRFHPQTAGRQYYIDGVELLDQSSDTELDVLYTYIWNNRRTTTDPTWVAGDNDVSFSLPDGRIMWFFNDSFFGAPNDTTINMLERTGTFIRNAMVVEEEDGTLNSRGAFDTNGKGQRAYFEIIPGNEVYNNDGSQKNFYWVGDAIMEDGKVKLYLVEVYGEARSAIAEFSYPQLELLDIKPQASFGLRFETMFVEDGTIYLYKRRESGSEAGVHVARTPVGNLVGNQMWEFWDGSSWVEDSAQSVSVLDNVMPDGVVKLQDNNYSMVSGLGALSRDLNVSFAQNPEGPWTTPVMAVQRRDDYLYWGYMPNIQPQLENGKYSVSYSSNAWMPLFFSSWSFADKYWYRQRHVQIDFLERSPYSYEEPNIALNKPVAVSSTDGGTNIGSNAVDGDGATRWTSEATDNEWIYVDFEGVYHVSNVKISWESAYASHYEIQVSEDATNWETVKIVADNSNAENAYYNLDAYGRYLRIKGNQRGTTQGYSIYEIVVNGTLHTDNLVPLVEIVTASGNTEFVEGSEFTLETITSDPDGSVAQVAFYRGTELLGTDSSRPFSYTINSAEAGNFSFTAVATDNVGSTTTSLPLEVYVEPFSNINLALNQPVTVSGIEISINDNFIGENAVDGIMDTRFASNHADNAWIYVDLVEIYAIYEVVLYWEASYGTEYKIQVSEDAISWTDILHEQSGDGGEDRHSFSAVNARYVKLQGVNRVNTMFGKFGYSLFEFEVYGNEVTALESHPGSAVGIYPNPVVEFLNIRGVDAFTPFALYDLSGKQVLCGYGDVVNVSALPSGMYILMIESKGKSLRRMKFFKK